VSIDVALKRLPTEGRNSPLGKKTVGAGAKWSGCFFDLLRWSVGRHGSSDFDKSIVAQASVKHIGAMTHCY
tara:strand:+ start:192 stop:404 length:213 start_codon:yes stop_codon:yes gene_type:complete